MNVSDVDITQPIKALDNLSGKNDKTRLFYPTVSAFHHNNGVPLFSFNQSVAIVDVDLRFNAGSARDESIRKDSFGLRMVADLLTKGTKNLDELSLLKPQLGIELGSAAYKDQFVINLRSLSESDKLGPLKPSEVLSEPRFDARF